MTKVSVIEGETAWTKCVATGKPPPTYTWIKQGTSQDLSKTDRFDVKKNTGDLIITRVEFNDDDIYKCIAENQAGRVESTVKIDVMVKPKIYELLNVTAPVNSDTKIMCKAKGRPKPNITFRKLSTKEPLRIGQQPHDRRIILEQQCIDTKGECFGILDITKLNRSDDGLYECIAENSAGTSYKNGHITVEFPPTFERTKALHKIAWAWNNHPGNLTCIPEAIPNATIIWKFNNRPITPDMLRFKQEGNGPISHLIVNSGTEHTFFTKYECVATNKLGSDSIWVELKEARVPEVITQIKAQSITATTIKFDIQPPPYFDTLPIRSFTVRYRGERYMGQNWELSANHTWSYRKWSANSMFLAFDLSTEMFSFICCVQFLEGCDCCFNCLIWDFDLNSSYPEIYPITFALRDVCAYKTRLASNKSNNSLDTFIVLSAAQQMVILGNASKH
jgi:neural cell adhesion molecule